jgi:acyl carrier protein phosphodiesterase
VTEAKAWFRPETRRVAPITLDVMWDHFCRATGNSSRRRCPAGVCALCPSAGVDHSARLAAALCESE